MLFSFAEKLKHKRISIVTSARRTNMFVFLVLMLMLMLMLMLLREWEQHKTNKWVRSSACAYVAGVLRAWLHGEFQPGLKFRSAHRVEILLRLHGQLQPGRKTQISVGKFTEVRKHNRYACSPSFFSPGWKKDSDYMDFSARAELRVFKGFVTEAGLKFQPAMKFAM